MKAFLMCGGKGERLKELTKDTPKCMLPIDGEPMFGRWLRKFDEWGFSEVMMNINKERDTRIIYEFLANGEWKGVRVVLEEGAIGTARTLLRNKYFLYDEELFAIVYSDVWTTFDLRKMVLYHKSCSKSLATMGVYIPESYEGKGIATVKDSVVTRFEEKPKKVKSPFIWSGIMVASPEIFSFMNRNMKDIATDLLPVLAKTGRVNAFNIEEPLWDIGASLERYREVNKRVKRMVKNG